MKNRHIPVWPTPAWRWLRRIRLALLLPLLVLPWQLQAQETCSKLVSCIAGAAIGATIGNLDFCVGANPQAICNSIRTANTETLQKWTENGGCGKILDSVQLLQAGKREALKQALLGAVKCGIDANSVDDIGAAEIMATACNVQGAVQDKIATAVGQVTCTLGRTVIKVANAFTTKSRPSELLNFPGVAAEVRQPFVGSSYTVLKDGCRALKAPADSWGSTCNTCIDLYEEEKIASTGSTPGSTNYWPCVFVGNESRDKPGTVVGQCSNANITGGTVVAKNVTPYPGTKISTWEFLKRKGASNTVGSCGEVEKVVASKGGSSCPRTQIDTMNNYYVWADFILPQTHSGGQVAFDDGGTWTTWGARCYSMSWKGQVFNCNNGAWSRASTAGGNKSYGPWCHGQNNDAQDNLNIFYGERPNIESTTEVDYYSFDADYYASRYPDLCAAFGNNHAALLSHYQSYGKREMRQATPVFDPRYYLDNNPDVVKVFGYTSQGARYHWYTYGRFEGRRASREFDPQYFNDNNPDLNLHYKGRPAQLSFYLGVGIKERRRGSAEENFPEGAPRCGNNPLYNGWSGS